ncbi:MAG TPA: hypothetical protein VFJ72_04545 [Rubrobacteraceae bacterium]|nr:hypothetical protein [Rubrobacteraceae bacterium]
MVRGCGSGQNANLSQSGDKTPKDSGAASGKTEETAKASKKQPKKEKKPEQPFAAIPPPKGAEKTNPESSLNLAAQEDLNSGSAAQDQYASGETTAEQMEPEAKLSVPRGQTLLKGKEDTSDGPLKKYRLVAYYGTPLSNLMGVLGESGPEEMMKQLKDQTRAYSAADPDRPAVPTIELIASVAQRDPGADGLYVAQTPKAEIERYSRLAKENHALLLLDVQLGRATVKQEIEILRPFLEKPYVHLAIDTEYSVEEGQVPGVDLGSVDGSEIQGAVEYLDDLVRKKHLPDKMLLVHEFAQNIVTNKQSIKPTDNVEVVLHADGFGSPDDKALKYGILARDEPIQYGGFKVFYKQDRPVLKPEDVLTLDPAPAVVTYQ